MDTPAWQYLLETIALHAPKLDRPDDRISWRLEPTGCFSTKSLYQAIAPSESIEPFADLWEIWLPLNIRIFLSQWLRGCLLSGVEVLKRNGPGYGICLLCAMEEDSNHIFFSCVFAQFLWSCFREVVGGTWCHRNLPDLLTELQATPPSDATLALAAA
ncbi:ABC transporter G family member 37 [Hordeum vulgare]|nr:ABC transporter G family member 37 [Hordeum vulgare]